MEKIKELLNYIIKDYNMNYSIKDNYLIIIILCVEVLLLLIQFILLTSVLSKKKTQKKNNKLLALFPISIPFNLMYILGAFVLGIINLSLFIVIIVRAIKIANLKKENKKAMAINNSNTQEIESSNKEEQMLEQPKDLVVNNQETTIQNEEQEESTLSKEESKDEENDVINKEEHIPLVLDEQSNDNEDNNTMETANQETLDSIFQENKNQEALVNDDNGEYTRDTIETESTELKDESTSEDYIPLVESHETTASEEDLATQTITLVDPKENEVSNDIEEYEYIFEDGEDDEKHEEDIEGGKITIIYRKSFMARLIQSLDDSKRYYVELVNYISSFKDIKRKQSWNFDSYNLGRQRMFKINIRAKKVNLYLALDPTTIESKYYAEDVSKIKRYAGVPVKFKVKSERGLKYAKELINRVIEDNYLLKDDSFIPTESIDQYPYDTNENLLRRELIKFRIINTKIANERNIIRIKIKDLLRDSVSMQEAHSLISDEDANTLMQNIEEEEFVLYVEKKKTTGKKFVINIDTLSQNYENGDTVTLANLKKKGLVPNKEKAIKVLARGVLDKQLNVYADDFSVDAIKMIILTKGKAVKTNK